MPAPRRVRPEVREAVYALVRQIPMGQLASYGMVASLLPGVTARMVGHALRGASKADRVPWQRVINASGQVSAHEGSERQRELLTAEGVPMSVSGRIQWRDVRWDGPSVNWVEENGLDPIDLMDIMTGWPS